jgi:hypothetical protein
MQRPHAIPTGKGRPAATSARANDPAMIPAQPSLIRSIEASFNYA